MGLPGQSGRAGNHIDQQIPQFFLIKLQGLCLRALYFCRLVLCFYRFVLRFYRFLLRLCRFSLLRRFRPGVPEQHLIHGLPFRLPRLRRRPAYGNQDFQPHGIRQLQKLMYSLVIIAFDGAGSKTQIRSLQHQILHCHSRVHHQAVDQAVLTAPPFHLSQVAGDSDDDRRLAGETRTEGIDCPHQLRFICHKEPPGLHVAGAGSQGRRPDKLLQKLPGNRLFGKFADAPPFFNYLM